MNPRTTDTRRFPWMAYVLALASTAATLWARFALGYRPGDPAMIVLFLIPVLLSAYAGGLGPGLVATAAGALVTDYYLMPPLHSLAITGVNGVQWAAYIVVGALLSLLLETHHLLDRRVAERTAELERERTDLRLMLKNMLNAFIVWESVFDENGKYVSFRFGYFNDAYMRIAGVKSEEVAGRDVFEVWPTTEQSWVEVYGEVARTGIPKIFDMYHEPTRGWYHCNAYRPTDSTARVCVIFEDITERKRAEAAAQESEQRFRTMANSIAQLAWIAHADGFIFWYNQRWYEYTGTTPEQMEGWGWQSVHDPQRLPEVLAQWTKALAAEEAFDMAFPLRGADGRFRKFLTRALPLKDAEGRVLQWFGTNTDVDELKRAEDEIRLLNAELERRVVERTAELEAANKELEAFSYSVSHDLRAPLRGIAGFSQALEESFGKRLDETERGYLGRVRAATERMGMLIDDLLDLSRVSRVEMVRQPVDLSALARFVIAELRQQTPARVVEVEIEDGLSVEGDPRLLRAVLENLLGNAWKFTGKKDSAHIAFRRAKSQSAAVTFAISDNGSGFDMRYAGKLFGAFQRLHTFTEFPGTGIGLATVQRIIQRHGGRIWAESAVEEGATFFFELPNPNRTN